jgi:Calcineurin-like phosphoesterase/Purple acid Phosphatase, N-terminal domain
MIRSKARARLTALLLAISSIGVITQIAEAPAAHAAVAPQLTRYPYLTDVVQTFATVNFATDRSQTTAKLKYGKVGQESCTAHSVSASKTAIVVGTASEYQWKAKLTGLTPNVKYCYRIFFGTNSIDLLGGDPSPQFWSALPAGSNQSYSFAVFGDWGDTNQQGNNPQQAALDASLGASGVRFALATGDTAYDSGSQLNYGDLNQTGFRVSSIFGPSFWPQAGDSIPLFSVPGNHGANATFFTNWPQAQAVASSNGKYQMETYCCANNSKSASAPSTWYAFSEGNARFYVLTAQWSDSNVGNSSAYGMDYAYRWQQNSAEYQWLQNDLQTHPSQLKFAIFHYPLYVDNATEPSDTFLQGPNSLEGLLTANGVNMVFNGHAHLYERNFPTSDGLVTYVTGGGGAKPEPISHCKPYDAYGIGWSQTTFGSKCGAAVKPTVIDQVYHYLRVDVNGAQVTVTPINALGQPFDAQVYDFSPDNTPPTAPSNLQATAPVGDRVDLTWDASTDASGIEAYDIYRDGNLLDSVDGATLDYSDTTVSANTHYDYFVKARDPSNNTSDASNTAGITTPGLDTEDPQPPTNLNAMAPSAGRVDLTWNAGSDNVGVTAYDIYRGGSLLTSVDGSTLAYSDLTVTAGTPYSYTVRARDAAGNTSVDSNVAQVTTPSAGVVFQDDFESGSLSMWSTVAGLAVSQGITAPSGGQWVARETASGGGATYAFKSIAPTVTDVYARFQFKVLSRTGAVDLMRFRNNSGGSKLSLLVDGATGKLSTRNAAGTTTKSNTVINTGQWYTVEIHGKVGAPSTTEVWLDGTLLPELGATGDLGSTNFGQFLLGQTGTTGTYDVVFDDVIVSKNPI